MQVNSRLISYVVGGLLILSGLVHLAMLLGDGGSWSGPLSLRKPTVFGLSFGITLITITWVTSFLSLRDPVVGRLLAFIGWSEERQLTVMRRVATAYVLLALGVAAFSITALV